MLLPPLPLPPSDNRLHRTGFRSNIRYRTKEYQIFLQEIQAYAIQHKDLLKSAQSLAIDSKQLALRITCFFEKSALITKKNTDKRVDVQNRLKALCDALAQLLHCDDSIFWEVHVVKKVASGNKSYTQVEIVPFQET